MFTSGNGRSGSSVAVRYAVPRTCRGVEQNDNHVAVGKDASHGWDKGLRHPGIERVDYLVEEVLPTVIRPG